MDVCGAASEPGEQVRTHQQPLRILHLAGGPETRFQELAEEGDFHIWINPMACVYTRLNLANIFWYCSTDSVLRLYINPHSNHIVPIL